MLQALLLPELATQAVQQRPDAVGLTHVSAHWTYAALTEAMTGRADGLVALGLQCVKRVGIYLGKCFETVVANFAAPLADAVLSDCPDLQQVV